MSKSSALLDDRNPRIVTAGYRSGFVPVTPATLGRPSSLRLIRFTCLGACAALAGMFGARARVFPAGDCLARIPRWFGDLLFMPCDEEAYWRGWAIERRHAGLSRRYRDPVFDTVARCSHCRGFGVTVDESLCAKCSGTGRITLDKPPFPCDG